MIIRDTSAKRSVSSPGTRPADYWDKVRQIEIPPDFICVRCGHHGWGEATDTHRGPMHYGCAKAHEASQRIQPA